MVQAVSQPMSFQEFLAWKPETGRYELHDGGSGLKCSQRDPTFAKRLRRRNK